MLTVFEQSLQCAMLGNKTFFIDSDLSVQRTTNRQRPLAGGVVLAPTWERRRDGDSMPYKKRVFRVADATPEIALHAVNPHCGVTDSVGCT